MNKIKNIVYFSILSLILSIFLFNFNIVNTTAYSISQGECVIELNSGRIVHANNEHKKLPMASTTKILTALTVIENFDLDKLVTVPQKAVGVEGSSIYLREGERLTVKELLYGLMLRSGNDCAECLALTCGNSREEFISLMNKTAKNCGAINSQFVNPHGLNDENHYTTAYDLALISQKAMANPIFKEIVSTKKIEISNEGYPYKRLLINKNKMLNMFDGCNGIKTGYTKKAGRCLVSSAEKNGLDFICVVINSPQMWERSTELLNNSFNNYELTEIVNPEYYNNTIFESESGKKFNMVMYKKFYYPLTEREKSLINLKINNETIDDFIKNPKENGIFEIFLENKLIFSQNIFTILCK